MEPALPKPKPKPLKIEMLRIANLKRYPENAYKHSPEPNAPIKGDIAELGWTTPILIDADNTVIDGHDRLQAAEQCGMGEVPVIRPAHLNPEQAQACRIADNHLTELGGWEHGMLSAELEALRAVDLDLELKGFDWNALEDLLAAEDACGTADEQGQLDERQGGSVQCPACGHALNA